MMSVRRSPNAAKVAKGLHRVVAALLIAAGGAQTGQAEVPGRAAGSAQSEVNEMPTTSILERVQQADWSLVQTPGAIGREAGPGLLTLLEDDDDQVRELAICALDDAGGSAAREGLIRGLGDPAENVRSAASRFVERHATADDIRALAEILGTSDDDLVREHVALALGRTDSADAIPGLQARSSSETDPEVTAALQLALARLGDPPMVDAYLTRLHSNEPATRAGALRDLPYLNDRRLVKQVLPLLSDERDAQNAGPGGHRFMIRVCDVAVQVLDVFCAHPFPFKVRLGKRYTDDELRDAVIAAEHCGP